MTWNCNQCTFINCDENNTCAMCDSPDPNRFWNCRHCSYVNPLNSNSCEMCMCVYNSPIIIRIQQDIPVSINLINSIMMTLINNQHDYIQQEKCLKPFLEKSSEFPEIVNKLDVIEDLSRLGMVPIWSIENWKNAFNNAITDELDAIYQTPLRCNVIVPTIRQILDEGNFNIAEFEQQIRNQWDINVTNEKENNVKWIKYVEEIPVISEDEMSTDIKCPICDNNESKSEFIKPSCCEGKQIIHRKCFAKCDMLCPFCRYSPINSDENTDAETEMITE